MSMRSVWQDEYTIRSYEAWIDGHAGVAALCNLMQESASRHADHLGVGATDLLAKRRLWALSRLVVAVNRYPVVGEHLAVQTWPRGSDRLFAIRDFDLIGNDGKRLAAGVSSWVVVDIDARRPLRPDTFIADIPHEREKKGLDEIPQKVLPPSSPEFQSPFTARLGDVDIQGHVNNVRFVTWFEERLAEQTEDDQRICRMEINFLGEAFSGNSIELGFEQESAIGEPGSTSFRCIARRSDGGRELATALFRFAPKDSFGETVEAKPGKVIITDATIAAAEKLAALSLSQSERAQVIESIADTPASFVQRRAVRLPNDLSPAGTFAPLACSAEGEALRPDPTSDGETAAPGEAPPLPDSDEDIAFAPVTVQSEWIRTGSLSSLRLTKIYLERLERFGRKLECVVTLMKEQALSQAEAADAELAAGRYRGPLHGIPWGAKDLLDTKGVPTTWGATPYRDRVPDSDSWVVKRMNEAGAVLLAKLTLGALAYNDIWFGGLTRNPWNPDDGSSGSSAGSAAATAAGLVSFAVGTETMGSIVSPSLRCGVTGLRPTFGRVPRTGAMALVWSYDKIGPICRTVADTAAVFSVMNGYDPADVDSRSVPFAFDPGAPVRGLRVGYHPSWFEHESEAELYAGTLSCLRELCREQGMELVEVELPDYPYASVMHLITVDAAAAFEELTLSDRDDELVWQDKEAWPNTFRTSRFIPAVEYVQVQRFRRLLMQLMQDVFRKVDLLVSPEHGSPLLLITNSAGTPSLTLRAGFRSNGTPFGANLWGKPDDEATLCRVGMLFEAALGVYDRRPSL